MKNLTDNFIGSTNSRGVALLIHSSLSHYVNNVFYDQAGRYIIANVDIDTDCYSFINIYAPNHPNERNIFFKTLNDKISEHATGSIILAGDFNEILDSKIDRRNKPNKIPKKTKASHTLDTLRKNKKLIDIWCIKNKQKNAIFLEKTGP